MGDSPLSQQVHSQQSPPSNPQAWVLYSSSHRPSPMRTTEATSQFKSPSKAADTPVHNTAHNSRAICHKENRAMMATALCQCKGTPCRDPAVDFWCAHRKQTRTECQKTRTKMELFLRQKTAVSFARGHLRKLVPHQFQACFRQEHWCSS